jgi:hypothetical protein
LDMLFDKYQSQRHFEEAVRVRTVINREQDKVEYYGHGFQQDMFDVINRRSCTSSDSYK